jgi:hypothetical protein
MLVLHTRSDHNSGRVYTSHRQEILDVTKGLLSVEGFARALGLYPGLLVQMLRGQREVPE